MQGPVRIRERVPVPFDFAARWLTDFSEGGGSLKHRVGPRILSREEEGDTLRLRIDGAAFDIEQEIRRESDTRWTTTSRFLARGGGLLVATTREIETIAPDGDGATLYDVETSVEPGMARLSLPAQQAHALLVAELRKSTVRLVRALEREGKGVPTDTPCC